MQGVILVYDITSAQTFQGLDSWLEILKREGLEDVPKIIVGNKSDKAEFREVKKASVQNKAVQLGAEYFEVSSKTGKNVKEAMESIMETVCQDVSINNGRNLKSFML